MVLSQKLKEIRQKRNYSQLYVAEKLHISRQAISKWENGYSYPDIDNLKLLSELYNVSLDILLDDNVNLDEVSGGKRNSEDREPTKTERQISNVKEQYTGKESFQLESINLYMFVLVSTIIPPLGIVICMIVFFKALRNGGRKQIALLLLCAFCAIIDIYNTLVVINNISNYWFWGSSTVEKISMIY